MKPNDTYGPTLGISPLKDGKAPELSEDVSGNGDVKFLNGSKSGGRYETLKGDAGEQNAMRDPQKTDSMPGDVSPKPEAVPVSNHKVGSIQLSRTRDSGATLTYEEKMLLTNVKKLQAMSKDERKAFLGEVFFFMFGAGYDPRGFFCEVPDKNGKVQSVVAPVYLPPSFKDAFKDDPFYKKYAADFPVIVDKLGKMPEYLKEAWNRSVSFFVLETTDDKDEPEAFFDGSRIVFNTAIWEGDFLTDLFHELGHAVDKNRYGNDCSVRGRVSEAARKAGFAFINHVTNGNYQRSNVAEAANEFVARFVEVFPDYESPSGATIGLQDMVSGATDGDVRVCYGHEKKDWEADINMLGREAFAEFFKMTVLFEGVVPKDLQAIYDMFYNETWAACRREINNKAKESIWWAD